MIGKQIWKKSSTKKKMLLLFELGKELDNEYSYGRNKNLKTQAWWIYKSFEQLYFWMPYKKKWKLRYFRNMSIKDTEKIALNWISTELNPIEGKNIWQSQNQPIVA